MTRAALTPRSPVAALIAFVTAAMLLLALPAGAQSGDNASEGPNYTVWNALAALAENTLEDMCRDQWTWQSRNPLGYEAA